MRIKFIGAIAAILALSACGASFPYATSEHDRVHNATAAIAPSPASPSPSRVVAVAAASPLRPKTLSCSAEIGAAAAARRVAIGRKVSPATRPPCNAANSCALIEDEIARSCALFDGKGSLMPGCVLVP